MLTVPGLQTVTVLRQVRQHDPQDPTKWARDSHGNAVYGEEQLPIPGCSVQPGSTTETDDDGRVRVTATVTIYAPLTWPGGPIDAVDIAGVRYELLGRPQRWHHPRLAHVQVTAQEVTG